MQRLRRHDLVWLRAGAPIEPGPCCVDTADEVAHWRAAGLPLVCARGDGLPGDRVRLGLTLPGIGTRRRVSLVAARADILRSAAPPPLASLADTLPAAFAAPMRALALQCGALGITPRVYGSLLWQWLSGEPCLRADSDIDLLFELDDAAALPALLVLLRNAGSLMRVDGEVRCGAHAVAWRELAAALDGNAPRRVLAKSDEGIALLDVGDLWPARSRAA
ncbi:malonate decarboxylase holo-[acyl-carrier-protein] synthase [Methyloversatilis thermotolerans]|uniref:malonate decarboxylase holo-[acyl-carrier-protein] synthase n=1 Tax=Methyloversatilis thermotolerans TaxID=1346290 RepID=UPI000365A9FA|nr:malonate decarboxylase holo-[acyl-carrier-protein] synthase [Methyloversatilis thermotolerans]